MRPLSATEAISPALERTALVLGRPFRWRTFLKIAAVAFFAELGSNLGFNIPGRGGNLHGIAPGIHAALLAFALLIGTVFFVVGLVLFYVGSRLQLVLVELVATRQTQVAPLWRKYGYSTWRWIGLKLLFSLLTVLGLLVLAVPIVIYLLKFGHGLSDFSIFHFPFVDILLFIAAAFVVLLVIVGAYMLLRDFTLPFLALEDLDISESLRRLRSLVAAEPGEFVLFLLLRLLLVFVFGIAAEFVIVLVLLVSLIPFGLVGGGLWFGLHHAGPAGNATLVACAVAGGLAFFVWAVCLVIGLLGSVYTFSQAYALYFLGGRYLLLGDLLDRSKFPPPYAYPGAFPPYPPPHYPPPIPPPPLEPGTGGST
jgi:hypothetical protein